MLTCLYLFGFRILQINFDRFGRYLATTLPVKMKNMTSDDGEMDDNSLAALVASQNEGVTLQIVLRTTFSLLLAIFGVTMIAG